jgi:hypothetical protein
MSALGQKQTYAVQNGMSALPPKATSIAYFHESAACCASATADQICARSKVVPSRLIERDYLSVSSLHRRTIWARGCHPARYRWRRRFIWARIAHRQASCFTRCLSFLYAEFAEVSLTSFSSGPSSGQGSCRNRMGATTLAAPAERVP